MQLLLKSLKIMFTSTTVLSNLCNSPTGRESHRFGAMFGKRIMVYDVAECMASIHIREKT